METQRGNKKADSNAVVAGNQPFLFLLENGGY